MTNLDRSDPRKFGFPEGSPIFNFQSEDRLMINLAYNRISGPQGFVKFWDNVLTEEQRRELGDDIDQCFDRNPVAVNHFAPLLNCSTERAIVEIAYRRGLMSFVDYERLVKDVLPDDVGETEYSKSSPEEQVLPKWDRTSGKLRYRGKLCRELSVTRAKSVVPILDAFEKVGWPEFLSGLVDSSEDPQKIHYVVRSMKADLSHISFTVQGESIGWLPTVS